MLYVEQHTYRMDLQTTGLIDTGAAAGEALKQQ